MSQPQFQPATAGAGAAADSFRINASWVNGVAPGYWPTKGSGLTLNLSAGTANIPAGTIVSYAGGTLSLADNETNYIFLDAAGAPGYNTTGFTPSVVPLAIVVTASGAISTIKKNGTNIFSADSTVAQGTAAHILVPFTSLTSVPLAVAAGDLFTIDITSGTRAWAFTAQLET